MILERLHITSEDFTAGTGWKIEPRGACKGDVCVPIPNGGFDLQTTAEQLGMAIVRDADHGLWALGPESLGGRALATAQAPELSLPDLEGRPFRLSSLRGRKIAVVAWAPY
jgi:hypothetical protein